MIILHVYLRSLWLLELQFLLFEPSIFLFNFQTCHRFMLLSFRKLTHTFTLLLFALSALLETIHVSTAYRSSPFRESAVFAETSLIVSSRDLHVHHVIVHSFHEMPRFVFPFASRETPLNGYEKLTSMVLLSLLDYTTFANHQ